MNQSSEQWSERLKRIRKLAGLDQEEMGRELGVTREWISKLENGRSEFSDFTKLKIEQFERVKGVHSVAYPVTDDPTVMRVEETIAPTPVDIDRVAASQRATARGRLEQMIAAVGSDTDRLGALNFRLGQLLRELCPEAAEPEPRAPRAEGPSEAERLMAQHDVLFAAERAQRAAARGEKATG